MEEKKERTFYSDASHNYLVMECPRELRDNYQYRMLAANQIRGLLPCSSRCIDNRDYLYYDITSRQSLEDLYDRRPIRGADIEKLLEDLLRLEKTLTEYLLDASHMVLDPPCIYVDFRGQECSFIYYPGEVEEGGWERLFTFLADRVDGKDKRAAALVYRLCMLAEKPGFRLREEVLEELGIRIGQETAKHRHGSFPGFADTRAGDPEGPVFSSGPARGPAGSGPNTGPFYEADGRNRQVPEYGEAFVGREGREDRPSPGRDTETLADTGEERGIPGLYGFLAAGLLLAGAGGLLVLPGRFQGLTEQALLLTRAGGGFLALAGAALILILLVRMIRGRAGAGEAGRRGGDAGREKRKGEANPGREGLYGGRSGIDTGSGETMGKPPVRWDEYSPYTGIQGDSGFSAAAERGPDDGQDPGRSLALPGETCLLGPDAGEPMGLYGTGACRGERISLTELPCVVGKMRDYVDAVLDDSSISRMHARFSTDREGKMTVRDLNSTNGTWINGERLRPNESRTMHQGDHVRLGRMEFVYR